MANPASDYPTTVHTPLDISAYAPSALGSTPVKHSEVHGKIEEELQAIQQKLGIGASNAEDADVDQVLTKLANGKTEWKDQASEGFTIGDPVANGTPNRILNIDGDGNLDDSRLVSQELDLFGGVIPNQYIGAVNVPKVNMLFADAEGVGGVQSLFVGIKGSDNGSFGIFNRDTFASYLVGVKGSTDEFSFGIAPLGTGAGVYPFRVDSTGFFVDMEQNMSDNKIVNLLDPTANQDAATKKYVDDEITGLSFVESVSSGTNITVDNTDPLNPIINYSGSPTAPGGSDSQVQYNNGGAFGGSSLFTFDDVEGLVTIQRGDDATGGSTQDLLNLKRADGTLVFSFYEDDNATNNGFYALLGRPAAGSGGYSGYLYAQDEATGYHTFRGFVGATQTSTLSIFPDSGNIQRIIANDLRIEPTNRLDLIGNTLNISAGPTIGHAALNLQTSGSPAIRIEGSNNNRRVGFGNNITSTPASKQVHIQASSATYVGLSAKAFNTSTSVSIIEALNSADVQLFGVNRLETVVNETGIDYDFRVEGDTDANNIFSDASTDRVGIGTNTPNNKLDVNGTIQADGLRLDVTPTAETPAATHTVVVNLNGTNYKLLALAA